MKEYKIDSSRNHQPDSVFQEMPEPKYPQNEGRMQRLRREAQTLSLRSVADHLTRVM